MKNFISYIVLPILVLALFIWQLDNLEKFFKKYPHAVDGATLIFVLVTTTISIVIAYKSYRNSIEQEIRKQQKHSNLLKFSINRKTQNLRTRINTVNIEHTVNHETEKDLLYIEIERKDTQADILKYRDILDKALSENPTGFTEEDAELISNRIMKLENLAFMVSIYMHNDSDELNKTTQEVLGTKSLKRHIQERIDAVTHKI